MRYTLKFIFIIILISCSSSQKLVEHSILHEILLETFKDDFFNKYIGSHKKIQIVTSYKDVYEELFSIENDTYKIDTVIVESNYLDIGEFGVDTGKFARLQLGCYSSNSEPYHIIYSTSYTKNKDGGWELISEVSPFLDTVEVKN